MTTQGKPGYSCCFIVVDSQTVSLLHVKSYFHVVCINCIQPLDVAFSCSPVSEQTLHQRSEQEDSQATVDLNTFLQKHKTADCIQKTHQLAEEQRSTNGGSPQHLTLEKSEGVTSHCCPPAAATTQDSRLQRECLK